MKLGIVIYSNDSETVWNAFRFGNFAIIESLVSIKELTALIRSLSVDRLGVCS